MKKSLEEVIKGARCCINLDGSDNCEGCPYVAAGEDCGHELDADLLEVSESAESVCCWTARALGWLRVREPDALITMVDAIGEMPEILRHLVFGADQRRE